MKILGINALAPKKMILAALLTSSVAAGASALNQNSKDSVELQKIETVDKSFINRLESSVKDIDEYDSEIIENIGGTSLKPLTKNHKTLIRVLTGIFMSVIGGMIGAYRGEKGNKHLASAENVSNISFTTGFLLPGISSAAALTAGLSVIAGSAGKYLSKGNSLICKFSSVIAGLVSAIKCFF